MADSTFNIVGNLLLKVDGAEAGLNKLKNSLSQLKMPANLDSNLKKSFSNLDGLFAKYKAQLKDGFNTKGDVTSFAKTGKQIEAEYDRIAATVSKLTGKDISFKVDLTTIQNLEKEIERVVTLKEKLSQDIKGGLGLNDYLKAMQASDVGRRGTKVFDASNMLQTSLGRGDIEKAKTDVEGLISELNRMSDARKKALENRTGIEFNQIITELRAKVTDADQAMNKFGNDIKTTSDTIAQIRADGVDKVTTALNEAVNGTDKAQSGFKQLNGTAQETANSMLSMTKQVEQLQQSTQYFFSLRNMINLFKRGIDDAIQSVKELDKAMTDTAVVTDYNISDLWGMLPEYTQIANELGATTQGAYETMTLYFQQGLDQQQAFEIGAETMKMARIAGLDYAEATDMMTAALRGFNMELNETSAQRINDVYSKIAAVTASDTEELGTAMQRTASIAHSAGMSFEGTTAFLAQAIETTREPAENLGTAMKTIIARFQELKKNPLEIGEVDGEEVDYNKIDTALKTIGVDLKDTNGQFRDLDKVFLDISQRWDGLTQTQQRYIATTAAGSRQQSRFIAMMSNYSRTVELMDAANNSAGASEEQFGKTMDSLEAKLNKLHNAWQQFTMGIANNGMIKMAVDGITGLLTVTNKLIDTFSLGIGPVKSLLSLLMAFTGLKAAGRIANSMIGGLGGLLDPQSSFFKGAKNGFIKNTDSNAQAHAISNPIVQAIHQLQAALTGKTVTNNNQGNTTASYQAFKTANSDLRTLLKENGIDNKLSLSSVYGKIGNLDNRQQASILKQLPGLQLSLQKNGIRFEKRDLKYTSQKLLNTFNDEINAGLKNKTLDTQTALKIFGTPQDFRQAMAARGEDYAKVAEEILTKGFDKDAVYAQELEKAKLRNSMSGKYSQKELEDIANKATDAKGLKIAQKNLEGLAQTSQTKGAMIANSIGNVGTAAMTAGQGIAQLGMQLSNAGFDTAGAAVTNLGYQISSLGQIAASAGSLVGKITDAGGIGGLISAHPYVAAAGVAIAAVGGIIALAKAQEKHAREAAEKTVKTYTDTINETTEKISTLNSAKDIFSQLSSGVDEYGNNIGLTTEEYDQYLQTSQEVAQIAPELIRGYDAQGRAIIATGSAIDQLISKQEELQNSARDTFVSDSSINDLISGIRVSDAFKDNSRNVFGDNLGLGYLQKQTGALKKALQSVGVEEFDAATKQLFGREINLINPSPDDLRLISEHYGDIYRLIESKNQDLTDRQKEGLQNAFADLGSGWKDMSEELQPLSQAIGQYLSSEGLDTIGLNLGEEFTGAFNAGLQDLTMTAAMENWDASEIKATARKYAEGFKEMTQEGSEYANIMEKVTAEQEKYDDALGEAGAIDNYKAAVEDYVTELENLADKYDDGTVAGQLFANSLRETAGHIRNYATESVVSLGEAINTLSDEFASARGAQERFQEATKGGDYYTAAEGYKGIIDTVLDEKNVAGQGSLTGWAGAEELLGRTFTDNHSWDEIVSQIKRIQDCFADGSDGVLAFNDLLVENQDKLKGLGYAVGDDWHFDLQTEDLAEYAEVLGMSEDALAGLIDKARQWVPFDLGDPTKIRQALEASEYSMQGTSSKGENLLYTSESEFREEARKQGIRGNDYTQTKADAQAQGIRFLNVENLTAKNQPDGGAYLNRVLDNIGLKGADKTLDNAVAALTKMGFSLEEQQQILSSDGVKLADGTASNEQIAESYNEQAYAMENPTVAGIANDTGIIASAATAMLASMGILTDDAKKDIEQSTSKDTVEGAKQTLNPESGFKTAAEHDAAVSQVQARIADYESTINLLKQSGNDALLPQIEQLEAARNSLQQAVDNDMSAWQTKLEGAKSYVEGIGKTVQEQSFLDAHAFDIQEALQSSDPTALVTTLQQLQQEGNLSAQTMIDLGASLSHLEGNEVYLAVLNTLMSNYQEQIKAARDATYEPFTITTKLTGVDLEKYLSKIDIETITQKEREILISADLYGDAKVSAFLNEINEGLDGGNETTKTVLIEATAKIANEDTAGANELLQNAFGDQAQEIESKLEIICDGSVANPTDVQQAIESEIQSLPIETQVETNVQANVTATYTGEPPKAQNQTINYTTTVNDSKLKAVQASAKQETKMPFSIEDKATSKINSIKSNAKQSVSFNVSPNFTGTWTKTLTINTEKKARGQNYSIPAHKTISFGSAAGGMNVPKPKKSHGSQMTALVGEEGFEVGYIPSEARSVIFGANGPEMTSFPKDTIIYPHDQSKEILRKGKGKHPTAGSFQGGLDSISSGGLRSSITGSSNNSNNSSSSNTYKTIKQTADKVEKKVTETTKVVQKVSVWWENIARLTEASQRRMDNNQKAFEKYIKEMRSTLHTTGEPFESGGGGGDDYIKSIGETIGYYEAQRKRAEKDLENFDKGTSKQQNAAQKVKEAKATKKNKKDDKKAKEQQKKARKSAYIADRGGAIQVSYESKGKKGKKSTKKAIISTSQYIKTDPDTGEYVIDQKKLNKIKNKSKRKAVADELNKEINDRISKRNKAVDEIEKLTEALEKMGEELYETFFAWEIELTKIWNITQKIEQTEARISRAKDYSNLLEAQLSSGLVGASDDFAARTVDAFKNTINQQRLEIEQTAESLNQQKFDLNNLLSLDDEKETLANIQQMLMSGVRSDGTELNETDKAGYLEWADRLEDKINAQARAWEFMVATQYADGTVDVNFDTDAFLKAQQKGEINETLAKEIQDYVKQVQENSKNISDTYANITSKIAETYTTLADLKEQWSGYAEELWDISEAETKKRNDYQKKLNDSLTNALKDLLDDVKKKLDQRRQQEDNAKTERDISQKQQRLAALRADTSGGHAAEIAQLQREIDEAQQSYGRTLEDQMIERMQQQADEASRQRERQIELQEEIAGEINNATQVNLWMSNPKDFRNEIFEAYKTANDYDKKPDAIKESIERNFESFYNGLLTNQANQKETEIAIANLTNTAETIGGFIKDYIDNNELTNEMEKVKEATYALGGEGSLLAQIAENTKSLSIDIKGTPLDNPTGTEEGGVRKTYEDEQARLAEEEAARQKIISDTEAEYNKFLTNRGNKTKTKDKNWGKVNKTDVAEQIKRGETIGRSEFGVLVDLANTKKLTWTQVLKAYIGYKGRNEAGNFLTSHYENKGTTPGKDFQTGWKNAFGKKWPKFASGGLANYTGPAWLDGTPSKPELVLNATDTKNFLALRDILSNVMKGVESTSNTYGDTNFEININVDKVSSDYDVDKIADRIEKRIVQKAGYRNVTQVRNFR